MYTTNPAQAVRVQAELLRGPEQKLQMEAQAFAARTHAVSEPSVRTALAGLSARVAVLADWQRGLAERRGPNALFPPSARSRIIAAH